MIWPPSVLRIRVMETRGKGIRLWLPIFLLWPLIGLMCLFAPIVMAVCPGMRRRADVKAVPTSGLLLLILFCRLRGFRVDVRSGSDQVHISFC